MTIQAKLMENMALHQYARSSNQISFNINTGYLYSRKVEDSVFDQTLQERRSLRAIANAPFGFCVLVSMTVVDIDGARYGEKEG